MLPYLEHSAFGVFLTNFNFPGLDVEMANEPALTGQDMILPFLLRFFEERLCEASGLFMSAKIVATKLPVCLFGNAPTIGTSTLFPSRSCVIK